MGIDVPTVLDALLEATAQEAAAKARIASLRASLEEEARRRFQAERAAPSWNAPELGKVQFKPPGKWAAMVVDDAAWGSWVAEHHSTEATGVIRLPAEHLEAALEAIGFALGEYGQPNTVTSTVEVRPAWSSTFLGTLNVDVDEEHGDDGAVSRLFTVTTPDGEFVAGVTGTRTPANLVVTLDKDRRTAAIDAARTAAVALLEVAQTDDGPEVDAQELDERRRYLEGLHADVLAAYAGRLELSKSGTKAELAERIARTEAITGRRELVPASAIGLPDGVTVHVDDTHTGPPTLNGDPVYLEDPIPPHVYDPEGPEDTPAGRSCKACGGHRDEEGTNHVEAERVDLEAELIKGLEEGAEQSAAEERGSVEYLDRKREAAILVIGSREDLRRFAKAKGIAPSGTKPDVAHRIAVAGHTADDVTTYLAEESTP